MFKQVLKIGGLVITSAVVLPYTVAFITNMLLGWPIGKHKFRRAFSPTKVYGLNVAILGQLALIKMIGLKYKWVTFYHNAKTSRIIKNIVYGGSHKHCVDIYPPHTEQGKPAHITPGGRNHPVVVFIYGGTWSSGDKKMYTLLCAELADKLQAVVCCPNYSIYPKGYVDDMVQDIVDCLKWIQHNIHDYNGDEERIMLIGHSSGGHLISLVTLELAMKQLMEHPDSMILSKEELEDEITPSMSVSRQASGIHFNEAYFNGGESHSGRDGGNGNEEMDPLKRSHGGVSSAGSGIRGGVVDSLQNSGMSTGSSFLIVEGSDVPEQDGTKKEEQSEQQQPVLSSAGGGGDGDQGVSDDGDGVGGDISESLLIVGDNGESDKNGGSDSGAPLKFVMEESGDLGQESDASSNEDDRITVEELSLHDSEPEEQEKDPKTKFDAEKETLELSSASDLMRDVEDVEEHTLSTSQTEAKSLLHSIKVVIGLAGVYHIGEHYEFEYWRGVEDVSCMTRAMYGPEHFDRLSPTVLVQSLPRNTRLPAFHLIHGSVDTTVPVNSSNKFCEVLSHMGARNIYMTEIPDCGHLNVCIDLMDSKRKYYNSVLVQILTSAQKFLR